MKSHLSIRLGLAVALTLATGIVTDAQTNWPTTKVARTVAAPKPAQNRKPKPTRKRRAATPVTTAATSGDLLRSMAELVTRQAAAIEAMARRLEAAEARLEQLASASAPGTQAGQRASAEPTSSAEPTTATPEFDDAQALFRAALVVDWAELISR